MILQRTPKKLCVFPRPTNIVVFWSCALSARRKHKKLEVFHFAGSKGAGLYSSGVESSLIWKRCEVKQIRTYLK